MKQLDEIIYDAIKADAQLMEAIGSRVVSTCFEVSPLDTDNTPLPNIIVTYDGFQNNLSTKDDIWESDEDTVQATVDIAAASPAEVKRLVSRVRRAVRDYIIAMYDGGEDIPQLQSLTSGGVAWDWNKPCYYEQLTFQCLTTQDNEQEEE